MTRRPLTPEEVVSPWTSEIVGHDDRGGHWRAARSRADGEITLGRSVAVYWTVVTGLVEVPPRSTSRPAFKAGIDRIAVLVHRE